MNPLIVALILTAFLYSSTQAALCSANPCGLGGYYTFQRGYQCIQQGPTALCICPGAAKPNNPCYLCDPLNPDQNVCKNTTGLLRACLETDRFGTAFAVYARIQLAINMQQQMLTAVKSTVTLTTAPTTTTASSGSSSQCANGGVFFNDKCNCPSGYIGPACAAQSVPNLCERIMCKNNGTCAIRNDNGPYEGVCLCRYGTWGEYCELIGCLGFCSASLCMNGGACKENVVGATRHAYCRCPAGYNGARCETRYFVCPNAGKFADPVLYNQGKYFDCTNVGGSLRLEQKSCPKGLRFNANAQLCTL